MQIKRYLLAIVVIVTCAGLRAQDKSTTHQSQENVDLLFDTKGVDFGPYIQSVVHDVKANWLSHIPQKAYPPELKRGKVAIQFTIRRDGKLTSMVLVAPSGDTELDRACWAAITGSSPFQRLPEKTLVIYSTKPVT